MLAAIRLAAAVAIRSAAALLRLATHRCRCQAHRHPTSSTSPSRPRRTPLSPRSPTARTSRCPRFGSTCALRSPRTPLTMSICSSTRSRTPATMAPTSGRPSTRRIASCAPPAARRILASRSESSTGCFPACMPRPTHTSQSSTTRRRSARTAQSGRPTWTTFLASSMGTPNASRTSTLHSSCCCAPCAEPRPSSPPMTTRRA
mmetsp:Transcript_51287/g.102073  ORF Transcript_51287/g.102073 Transcript_51287/m.102073 type:complete len:203 (+) Transcript_51287:334-942(+)